ncbi:: SMI1_KNR4 [Gemmataceae bacterium]|nr:: SMI1_KNR4 [Gemmataceae bacterium]VTU00414.1 : SMI1_KNR4 [Gemmataceae bacterium]
MDYSDILGTVIGHLEGLGIECTATAGEDVGEAELASAEATMGVQLPAELREFYQAFGDGVGVFWRSDPDDFGKPWGSLNVPTLASLAEMYHGWRGLVLYTPEQAEKYGFPYTDDPALAKRTAARMWHWLPIIDEPNGDAICLDLGAPGCPVVFNRHDWMDGGTGDDGHILAPSWRAFLMAWGSVCYQDPVHWTDCLRQGGGVDWSCKRFDRSLHVAGLMKCDER